MSLFSSCCSCKERTTFKRSIVYNVNFYHMTWGSSMWETRKRCTLTASCSLSKGVPTHLPLLFAAHSLGWDRKRLWTQRNPPTIRAAETDPMRPLGGRDRATRCAPGPGPDPCGALSSFWTRGSTRAPSMHRLEVCRVGHSCRERPEASLEAWDLESEG